MNLTSLISYWLSKVVLKTCMQITSGKYYRKYKRVKLKHTIEKFHLKNFSIVRSNTTKVVLFLYHMQNARILILQRLEKNIIFSIIQNITILHVCRIQEIKGEIITLLTYCIFGNIVENFNYIRFH